MSRRLSLGGCSSALSASRFFLGILLISIAAVATAAAEPSAEKPLTALEQQRLKERDRYSDESAKLEKEGKLPEAIAASEKMLAIEREMFGNDHADVAGSLGRLARMQQNEDNFEAARQLRREALAIKEKLFGKDSWKVTDARLALADVDIWAKLKPEDRNALAHCDELLDEVDALTSKHDYKAALPLAKQVLETRTRILGKQHRLTAFAASWLASIYNNLRQYAEAEPVDLLALESTEAALGKTHPYYASVVSTLANLYDTQHDDAKAEPLYRQAIAIRKAALGPTHPDYRKSVSNLSDLLGSLATRAMEGEDWTAARKLREEILRLQMELHGDGDWRVTDVRLALADVEIWSALKPEDRKALARCDEQLKQVRELVDKRNYATALATAKDVLEIRTRLLGPKHRLIAFACSWIGRIYYLLEQYPAAEPYYRRALEIEGETFGKSHPEYAICVENLGNFYVRQKDYTKAEPLLRQAMAIRNSVLGPKHADYRASVADLVSMLDQVATAAIDRADWEAARKSRGEILRLETELYGGNDWRVTDARLALADVDVWAAISPEDRKALSRCDEELNAVAELMGKGLAEAALAQAKNVLETRARVLGKQHHLTALANIWLGRVYDGLGQYASAESCYRQAAEIDEQILGKLHPDYAVDVNNLALLYQTMGNYARAELLFREALDIRKQAFGEKHRVYAAALNNLASLYAAIGDYARAENLYRQALDITAQALGEKHSEYARNLNNLAYLYEEMGDYPRSLKIYRRASQIYKQAVGEKNPTYATSLNNLAFVYKTMGDFAAAEPLYRQSLEIRRQVLGERHPDYATSLNNLAALYMDMGDVARAEPLFRQSLEIERQVFGEKHTVYAISLCNLADLYEAMGDNARAEPLLRQAVRIQKQALGEKHPAYAASLNALGKLYSRMGDNTRAEPLYRQAAEIAKEVLGERHPDYANYLNSLALVYQNADEYARAEPLFRQSLEINKQVFGDKHPRYASGLNNLAMLLLRMHEPQQAVGPAGEAVHIIRDQLDATADVQSEREQLTMNQLLRVYLDNYLSATASAKSPGKDEYPAVLAWKGAVTARQQVIQRMRQAGQEHLEPQIAEIYKQLAVKTAALANLSQSVPKSAEAEAYRARLQQLHDEVELLQQKLATASAPYRHELEQRRRTPDDLRHALPAQTVLVDLLEYWHTDPPKRKGQKANSHDWIAAFILRPDAPVERIELGPSEPIRRAIAVWRWRNLGHPSLNLDDKKAIEATLAAWKTDEQDAEPAARVRELVWDKLQPHLNGAKTVLLSPDEATAQFPWPALPGKNPGSYLIEDVAIAVVPVPRLLPELLATQATSVKPPATSDGVPSAGLAPSLLLVGDVNFDADPGKSPGAALAVSTARGARTGPLHHWPALPGTRSEMLAVADSFEQEYPDDGLAKLRGDRATKGAVVAALMTHRYVHLATHGFFAPGDLKSAIAGAAANRGGGPGLVSRHDMAGLHPELLSGLVLAGANSPPSAGRDNGILTALEVEQLDLGHLDLATLSACETGLGNTAGGEGVLGLQRAFQVAGAKTVVATLWTIDDNASRSLMVDFYENLWKKKLPKLEALRQAQLTMLREGIKRGLSLEDDRPADKNRRLPPYYWAAFELSGDWR
jgi:CHAT domain-containing protein/Tfp pilus assembly protein PilF